MNRLHRITGHELTFGIACGVLVWAVGLPLGVLILVAVWVAVQLEQAAKARRERP